MSNSGGIKPPPRPSLKKQHQKIKYDGDIPKRPRSILAVQSEREYNKSIDLLKGKWRDNIKRTVLKILDVSHQNKNISKESCINCNERKISILRFIIIVTLKTSTL